MQDVGLLESYVVDDTDNSSTGEVTKYHRAARIFLAYVYIAAYAPSVDFIEGAMPPRLVECA